jgi:mRNA-degrading endonuclease RelE of RelBE toxin-antitoxin system
MIYSFKNRPLVEADIIIAVEHYKEINLLLAKQFLLRIKEAKKHIAQTPFGFQVKYNNVRTVSLKQFPYLIHYLIDDDQKQIVILAITHSYKDPKDYSNR